MLPDDTRSTIENITHGIIIEGNQDSCTTIRNLLCSGFPTSTTVKEDFEGKSVVKEEQAKVIETLCFENNLSFLISPTSHFPLPVNTIPYFITEPV